MIFQACIITSKREIQTLIGKDYIKQSNNVREQYMQDPLFTASDVLNCNIDLGEVKAVVMKSKQVQSPGIDLLLNEVYKNNAVI